MENVKISGSLLGLIQILYETQNSLRSFRIENMGYDSKFFSTR